MASTGSRLSAKLRSLLSTCSKSEEILIAYFIARLDESILSGDIYQLARIEKLLWPAKILDANIPSFIISIQPQWAENLFDTGLAEQNLFGVDPFLALNIESVYYRSRLNAKGITAPARILWYVSQGKAYYQTMSIRACSFLDEVVLAKPQPIYKRFRRLGVYQWNDIYKLAKFSTERDIMALKFSYTELLKQPLPLKDVKKAFDTYGINSPLQSPILLP